MRYFLSFITLLTFSMFFLSSCQNESTPMEASQNGILTIYLTDAPTVAEIDSVNITFSQVSAHRDSEWVTVQGDTTINLRDLSNGNIAILGSAEVPAGRYTQIRIKIDSAYVVLMDGEKYPMSVPSGAQTGLKLGPQFIIEEGVTYELVVDFDVSRSVLVTPHGYILKPYLRVEEVATTGSISGTVTNPESLPTAFAIQYGDTITSSLVDPADGFFKLSFLPSGYYTVSIRDNLDRTATIDAATVFSSSENDLGEIELQ